MRSACAGVRLLWLASVSPLMSVALRSETCGGAMLAGLICSVRPPAKEMLKRPFA